MSENKYILSYQDIINKLDELSRNYKELIIKKEPIGYTTFGFPIEYYTIGNGKKDVILISLTHGCEITTIDFMLKFILTILEDSNKYVKYLNDYTFHIIPILNPEGYVISSSQVIYNVKDMDTLTFQKYCKKFRTLYDQDDLNASKGLKSKKLYKTLMKTSSNLIFPIDLRNSVDKILKDCNLDSSVLPIWSSNGMGIDINANSIHEFDNMKDFKDKSKFGKLRYNDIPVDRPSPHGYPGDKVFDERCPENLALYNFVNSIYDRGNLKLFISYHSTGAEIYGYPNNKFATKNQYMTILNGMNYYKVLTNYSLVNEKMKYGVMDYYRIRLENTVTLTVELSRISGNPIGPFSNLKNLNIEFNDNISAILYTLNSLK